LRDRIGKLDWNFMAQLGWVALYAALAVAAMLGTELVITKLLAADQARPQQEALASLVSLAMLLGLVAAVSAALVFLPAQFLQTAALRFGVPWSLLTVPVGALASWYCFDRILPLDVNLGFNGLPARPGAQPLDWPSYATAFGFQAAVSGISLSRSLKRGRSALLLALAVAALTFGVVWGRAMAELHPAPNTPPVSSSP
jgi:hypothetical protein